MQPSQYIALPYLNSSANFSSVFDRGMTVKRIVAWMVCLVLIESALCADVFAIRLTDPARPQSPAPIGKAVARLGSGE